MSKGNPHVKLMHLYADQCEKDDFPLWQFKDKYHSEWTDCPAARPEWRPEAEYRPKPTPHVHAKLMAEYAKDAANTETPWEFWEYKNGGTWRSCIIHPPWNNFTQYRRKVN